MAVTKTSAKGSASKVKGVERVSVASWAQNDTVVVTHAKDPLWARQVKVITLSTKLENRLDSVYTIEYTSDTTTTIKALAASPVAVEIIVVVPTT